MELETLVAQVKKELSQSGHYDMRTFDFYHFEHPSNPAYDTVEFYIYEKPSCSNRQYVTLTYELLTGSRLFRMTRNNAHDTKEKVVAGFERAGRLFFFSKETPESKVFAKLLAGKLTKLKDFPETEELKAYKTNKFLEEIDAVEHQVHRYTQANFEDLRDFVAHNI